MPKDRTPDSRGFLSRTMDKYVRNRRPGGDIELPASGPRDPRLPPEPGGVGRSLKEAAKGFKTVRELGRR